MINEINTSANRALSGNQILAIKKADSIATLITSNHPALLAAITGKRIQREKFLSIAITEADALEKLGATTQAVRMAIVIRVCKASLELTLRKKIKRDVLGKRPTNLTDEARQSAKKMRQIFNWNDRIDAKLLELASTKLHTRQPYAGTPNWKVIASEMNISHGIELTIEQWCRRAQFLREKQKRSDRIIRSADGNVQQ